MTWLLMLVLGLAVGGGGGAVVKYVAAIIVYGLVLPGAGAERVVQLGNGCVCCSVKDELAETIAELCANGHYGHVLVETTGVADPRGVADLFVRKNRFGRSLSDFARLSALVTVIDARAFLAEMGRSGGEGEKERRREGETERSEKRTRNEHEERVRAGGADEGSKGNEHEERERVGGVKPVVELMVDQAECADVLVLNKCDVVSEDELGRLEAILRGLNPRAEILRTERGQVASEGLLDRVRFDAQATLGAARWIRVLHNPARLAGRGAAGVRPAAARHEDAYGIRSFVFEARRALVREKFLAWLAGELPAGLLRAKGFFWFAEQPADIGFLSVAGGAVRTEFVGTWAAALVEAGVITAAAVPASARERWAEPHGDRRVELVFIGVGLDEAAMRAELETCLL